MAALGNVLTQWARLIMGTLHTAGVRDLVISPGSRNSALVAAALRQEGLCCHSVIDERSAAFFALGMARLGGPPPVLLCTSGSALAHYLPGLVEATHAGLPVIVLSADRPQELWSASAPQTIAQLGIFGGYAKESLDLGDPADDDDNLRAVARKVFQAVWLSQSGTPGPVHINVPARKPLEPVAAVTPEQRSLEARVSALLARDGHVPAGSRLAASAASIEALASFFRTHADLLISVGPLPTALTRRVVRLAETQGCFAFCEQPGFATPVDGLARGLTGQGAQRLPPPGCIVHFGPPPISSAWQAGLKSVASDLVIVGSGQYPDPTSRARLVVCADLSDTLERLELALAGRAPVDERARFTAIYERGAQAVKDAIERETALAEYRGKSYPPRRSAGLPEPALVAQLLGQLPQRSNLCLGNSLPVRLAAWVAPVAQPTNIEVFTQRGANGIDGLIAGAAGVAQKSGLPTLLLIGDVSATHDLGSLAIARHVRTPFCICVLDNDGGRIFEHLPLGPEQTDPASFRFWTSPPELNWEKIAQGFGVTHRAVRTMGEVPGVLQRALEKPGATLLTIATDPQSSLSFLRVMGPGPRPPGGFN